MHQHGSLPASVLFSGLTSQTPKGKEQQGLSISVKENAADAEMEDGRRPLKPPQGSPHLLALFSHGIMYYLKKKKNLHSDLLFYAKRDIPGLTKCF